MSIDAFGIHLGPLYFRFYGIIIMSGAIAAAFVARWKLKEDGEDADLIWDALMWALALGIVGARIWHILTPSKYSGITTAYYLSHPLAMLATWNGGLGIPGGILGGILGLYIFSRRRKINLVTLLDAAAPAMALAQAVGRWGNFVNQELYGPPTDLPWGIFIRPEYRIAEYASFERFHPLFLYESIWNLLAMFLMLWLWRKYKKNLKPGDIFLIYLIAYPVGRFLLEFIRLDFAPAFGVNVNQITMLIVALASSVILFLRHRGNQHPV
ncbi:MAG: prolipoprotein diacylglyceryl transferase [Anaerolineales bacterium]|nr:prolipoprotein diacylglyceryl transferase [Anaerolineales bacterium]